MSFKSSHLFVLLSVAATLAPRLAQAQPTPSSALSPDEDRRRALYQQGKDAIKAQRWVDAKTRLGEAWAIRPSHDVALALSQAEFNLEYFPESAEHLAYYFRNVSAKENENNLANAKLAFEAVKAKVCTVQLSAPKGAEVLLDGKAIGTAPLEASIFVKPGRRVFEARSGERKAEQELQAVAGKEQSVALSFPEALQAAPAPSSIAVEAGLPDVPKPATAARSMVPVYIGAGLTAVGLGVGIGFALAAGSDHDDIDAFKEKNGPSGCSDGTAAADDCAAQRDAAQARDRHLTYEVIGFSVAGAALVGTATYFFWPESNAATGAARGALKVSGGASPDGASLWILGNF